MRTVVIFRETLLHISETFIAQQAGALRTFHPEYVGWSRPNPSLDFQGSAIYLNGGHRGLLSKWRVGLYRRLPFAPIFHRRVKNLKADLIHAHFASDGLAVSSIAEGLRLPLIVTLHGADITIRQDFAARYRKLWTRASLFICVSEFIRNKALEAGFPEDKLKVHYIGLDTKNFQPPSAPRDPNSVLFVGRLVEKKGCEVVLRAMQIVQAKSPDVALTVIGEGPLRAGLMQIASELGIQCQFLGGQPPDVIRSWMRKASVLCAPSQTAANGDSEGLPIVILEAQASGIPVVSTLHSGIPEAILHGETGLLVGEGDVHGLAEGISFYLSQPATAARHGLAGRDRVANKFNLFNQTQILEEIYERIILH